MEEKMSIEERYQYLRRMKKRYIKASRKERSHLLDEMEAYTNLHRKSLIRLLRTEIMRHPRTRERGPSYSPEIRLIIAMTAKALDYPCAERLQPVLLPTAQNLARLGTFYLNHEKEEELARISMATLRRILKSIHRDKPRHILHPPQDHNPLQEPGHLELDLVHHCGTSASGEYVHTMQMVDIATGWVEQVAVLGRELPGYTGCFPFHPQPHPIPNPGNPSRQRYGLLQFPPHPLMERENPWPHSFPLPPLSQER
jgi:hypothetical protein